MNLPNTPSGASQLAASRPITTVTNRIVVGEDTIVYRGSGTNNPSITNNNSTCFLIDLSLDWQSWSFDGMMISYSGAVGPASEIVCSYFVLAGGSNPSDAQWLTGYGFPDHRLADILDFGLGKAVFNQTFGEAINVFSDKGVFNLSTPGDTPSGNPASSYLLSVAENPLNTMRVFPGACLLAVKPLSGTNYQTGDILTYCVSIRGKRK